MKRKYLFAVIFTLLLTFYTNGQNYSIAQTGVFAPQNKKVILLKDDRGENKIILFQTDLRVNTDGSPNSYHPYDLRGREKAINNICNAIVVKKGNSGENLCFSNFAEAIGVFEKFRDSDFQIIPDGYKITWENVLATDESNGRRTPCILKSGTYAGYFGSLTSLKNGILQDKGECESNDQINSLEVPALVLVGGKNVVKDFGARVGDLVVAYNPAKNLFTSAIIGDTGPKDNLGEGSVRLNMKLLGEAQPPVNRADTRRISISEDPVMIAVIPASNLFEIAGGTPFTEENIDRRLRNWQKKAGFASFGKFIEFIAKYRMQLN